ncbi:hypothetical protein [Nonomuraea sp. NPDC049607]|uniref:hypothetical protein n=1 Tax=Nonomuraea sp. NPDC049607 TaxID=3154732 RepID=UPI003445E53F
MFYPGARRLAVTLLAALTTAVLVPSAPAPATPVQAKWPIAVLLCKFLDRPEEPEPPQFFKELLTAEGLGKGGLADFVAEQSRGRVALEGGDVHGWYTIPKTYSQWSDEGWYSLNKPKDCVRSAQSQGWTRPPGSALFVIINTAEGGIGRASYNARGDRTIVLDSTAWTLNRAAYEFGRLNGLNHRLSQFLNQHPTDVGNPYDTMSASTTHFPPSERFGEGAIAPAAPSLDELGWLPGWRVTTLGKDGAGTRTVRLAPIEQPERPGALMVRVPYDPKRPDRYLTVEFRKKTGRSSAIPKDSILIHQYQERSWATLLMENETNPTPIQSYRGDGVEIKLDSMTADSATVTVSTDVTGKCGFDYVPRAAVAGDNACVTPAVRDSTAADNADQPNRLDANGACRWGYVHREITLADVACVSPTVKNQAEQDTAATPARINVAQHVWGPNACQDGYVWRMADDSDYVCVSLETRYQTLDDNAAAAGRWTDGPAGPKSCVQGYVWREAYVGDQACVTPARRDQARADNAAAWERVKEN